MDSRLNSLRSASRVIDEFIEDLEPEHVASEGKKRSRLSTSVFGILLVVGGVLGAIITTRAATQSTAVLAASRELARGEVLDESDLQAIDVPRSAAKYFFGRNQVGDILGTMVSSTVLPGTPLTPHLISRQPTLDPSMILIAVAVDVGNYPPMLAAGDDVSVVVSPDATIVEASPPRVVAERLRVWDISRSEEGGDVTVVTLVGDPTLALAVAGAGNVHLGLVQSMSQD